MLIVIFGLIMVTIGMAVDEADRVKKDHKPWLVLFRAAFGIVLSLWLPSVAYFTLTRLDVPLSDLVTWLILYPGTFIVGLGLILMIYGKTHLD